MIRALTTAAVLAATLVPRAATALEFQTYFMKRPMPGHYLIEPCSSTRDSERDDLAGGVPWLATRVYQPFFTAPEDVERVVPAGTATATLYLTTGANGQMNDCAEVGVQLARETSIGTFLMAEGVATTSLFPKFAGGLGNPAVVDITIGGPESSRTLAPGDSLRMTVSVTNVCADQNGRQITLRYDSRSLASRIRFENVNVPDEGGAADPDRDGVPSLCDNCPDTPNPSQTDSNNDGIGDACTPCTPGGPTPPQCVCLGDGCDDGDRCSLDSCSPELGCVNFTIPGLPGARCRLETLTTMVDAALPADLDPRLQRNRSPLKRSLRKAFRVLGKAERSVIRAKPARKVERKIQKLRALIAKFAARVEAQRLKSRVSGRLRTELVSEATRAITATADGPS